jgi:hypothetical protein
MMQAHITPCVIRSLECPCHIYPVRQKSIKQSRIHTCSTQNTANGILLSPQLIESQGYVDENTRKDLEPNRNNPRSEKGMNTCIYGSTGKMRPKLKDHIKRVHQDLIDPRFPRAKKPLNIRRDGTRNDYCHPIPRVLGHQARSRKNYNGKNNKRSLWNVTAPLRLLSRRKDK